MTRKYSNKMIAQANAMEAEGISTRRTVERLEAMYPGETIPQFGSVAEWRRRAHEFAHEKLEDNELVIGLMSDEVTITKLEWAKKNPDKIRLLEPATTGAIYRDKGFKRQELKQKAKQTEAGQALADAINRLTDLTVPERDAIIEGECVVSDS